MTLAANALGPGLLDRYLARTGFQSQQTQQPHDPSDPGNLFRPVDTATDEGAHGDFDRRGHARSLQLWASQHHGLLAATASAAAAAAAAASAVGGNGRWSLRGGRRPRR
jgi:hypothetical protein